MRANTRIIVEDVPAGERDNFPKFLAGNVEIVNPLDEPTDRIWLFEFKGQSRDGSERFFIWQIPGRVDEEKWVRHLLIQKVGEFGLCRLWIYSVCKPCTAEQLKYIRMLTKSWKEAV